uniref:AlNc14C396G11333 protein n=1 Tax=Albugo laibachii Nc14 TaxID=890382 RepID=F0WYS2_9STRA|nr:AlNc14C396G11333 [Albugo laibachii Nc14]|eukprot:CCA26631.1 AlNc14C396G11333 [Albugo laibachii Nc14]
MSYLHGSYSNKISVLLFIMSGAIQLDISAFGSCSCMPRQGMYTHFVLQDSQQAQNKDPQMSTQQYNIEDEAAVKACGKCPGELDGRNFGIFKLRDKPEVQVTERPVKQYFWIGKNIKTTKSLLATCIKQCSMLNLEAETFKFSQFDLQLHPKYAMAAAIFHAPCVSRVRLKATIALKFFSCF